MSMPRAHAKEFEESRGHARAEGAPNERLRQVEGEGAVVRRYGGAVAARCGGAVGGRRSGGARVFSLSPRRTRQKVELVSQLRYSCFAASETRGRTPRVGLRATSGSRHRLHSYEQRWHGRLGSRR